jgi:hypothetical protein
MCSSYFLLGVSQLPGHNNHQLHARHQASSTWIEIWKSRVFRKAKYLEKPRLILPIGRRSRKYYTKNS